MFALSFGGLMVLGVVISVTTTADASKAEAARRNIPKYTISVTSDPPRARVYLGGEFYSAKRTPTKLTLTKGEHTYRVAFEDYEDEWRLYKPFRGKLNVSRNESISVWLDRRTAEEIATIEAKERARAEAEYAALEAELDRERVYYRIDTNCQYGANLTYFNIDGNITQQNNMGSDWYYYMVPNPGQYLSLSAQNQCDYGYVTVKIVKRDIALEENTSSGAYVIASVSGTWD